MDSALGRKFVNTVVAAKGWALKFEDARLKRYSLRGYKWSSVTTDVIFHNTISNGIIHGIFLGQLDPRLFCVACLYINRYWPRQWLKIYGGASRQVETR